MTPAAGEGGSGRGAHLQRGVHDLVHGGEVGVPQELGVLLEGQHTLRVDAAHGGGDLCRGSSGVLTSASPQPGSLSSAPSDCANHPTGQPLPTGVVPPVSPLPGAASGPGFPRVCAWEYPSHLPPGMGSTPGLQLGWDPHSSPAQTLLHLPRGALPGSAAGRGSPPDLAGGCTSTGIRIWGRVPGVGQDLDSVPAAGASRCPPQQLCPSRWPRRRAAPSRHSAAPGCRRPVGGPRRLGQSPRTPLRGCRVPLPTLYLQSLEEAEGAQAPAPGHDAEGGVVQQLLVVKPGVGDGGGGQAWPPPLL